MDTNDEFLKELDPYREEKDLPDLIPIDPARPKYLAKIVVDKREMRSHVAAELDNNGVIDIEFRTLSIGDYVVSDRVDVERKTHDDFWSTFLNRREFFSQIYDLMRAYKRPLMIIEGKGGSDALFNTRMVDPVAVRAILQTVAISFRIPILYTESPAETARTLTEIAIREQNRDGKAKSFSLHGRRSHMSISEQQKYILTSITDIGPSIADALLKKHGNIERVLTAPKSDLLIKKKVGDKTADHIREMMTVEYKG